MATPISIHIRKTNMIDVFRPSHSGAETGCLVPLYHLMNLRLTCLTESRDPRVFTGEGPSTLQAGLHSGRASVQRGGGGGPVPPHRDVGAPIAPLHTPGPVTLTTHRWGPYRTASGSTQGCFLFCIPRREETHREIPADAQFCCFAYCSFLIH